MIFITNRRGFIELVLQETIYEEIQENVSEFDGQINHETINQVTIVEYLNPDVVFLVILGTISPPALHIKNIKISFYDQGLTSKDG